MPLQRILQHTATHAATHCNTYSWSTISSFSGIIHRLHFLHESEAEHEMHFPIRYSRRALWHRASLSTISSFNASLFSASIIHYLHESEAEHEMHLSIRYSRRALWHRASLSTISSSNASFFRASIMHSFMRVTWLIHMCGMTHSYVWHDSFICVTWLLFMCSSFIWLIHMASFFSAIIIHFLHESEAEHETCFSVRYSRQALQRRAMSHTFMTHVTHICESCHTHSWVMSHTSMSHVTHIIQRLPMHFNTLL